MTETSVHCSENMIMNIDHDYHEEEEEEDDNGFYANSTVHFLGADSWAPGPNLPRTVARRAPGRPPEPIFGPKISIYATPI